MKQITIHQEGCLPVIVTDNDTSTVEEYSKGLSDLLKVSNVTVLHTSQSSTIIRPSKINSIVVESLDDEPVTTKKAEKQKIEPEEDIITDLDS